MVTQKNPFFKAERSDPYYKAIVYQQAANFWSEHAKESPDAIAELSEPLKDLVFLLLQEDPVKRLSISEIMQHEWMAGPTPTQDEIKDEFTKRYNNYSQDEMISNISTQEDYDISPDDLDANNYHRGLGSEDDDDTHLVVREAKPYSHQTRKLSQFFSKSDVEVLFRNLTHFVDGVASKHKFSKSCYGVNFETINDDSVQVDVTVNILKVPDEEMH
mmetsp:Transcript_37022/g.36626  ORF Transcript_37022/g.36626 Transcript_37022/m.36626 type:complete len:216 (-) Transcript_37022:186-833(-)